MSDTAIARAGAWSRRIRRDVLALWIAARDPRTPWRAKALAAAVATYALSPIDLIPDFIPLLGYLDDLLIVPLGIVLAVRLIPRDLMAEFRILATELAQRPTSRVAAAIIVSMWFLAACLVAGTAWSWLG